MIKALKAKRNKKGFTLMEMLIVIAIIAILVAIAIPTFSGSLNKAKYAADVANVRAWYAETQIELMMNESATVPTSYDGEDLQLGEAEDLIEIAGTSEANFKVTYTPPTDSGFDTRVFGG